jgi:hypothetical protein
MANKGFLVVFIWLLGYLARFSGIWPVTFNDFFMLANIAGRIPRHQADNFNRLFHVCLDCWQDSQVSGK